MRLFIAQFFALIVLIGTCQAKFHVGEKGYLQHLNSIFQPHNQKLFQESDLSSTDNQTQEIGLEHYKKCSIYVETNTGLFDKGASGFDYIRDKIDNDLCRYKEQEGLDVDLLWKGFKKYLKVAGVYIKDPSVYDSCNTTPKRVWVSIKGVYTPVVGYFWTGYVKPEGTHDKLSAAIKINSSNSESYNITKTATLNLALKFLFSKKLYVLQSSISEAIPEDGEPIKIGRAAVIKAARVGYSHGEKDRHFQGGAVSPWIPAGLSDQIAMAKENSKPAMSFVDLLKPKPCTKKPRHDKPQEKPSFFGKWDHYNPEECQQFYAKYGILGKATAQVMCPKEQVPLQITAQKLSTDQVQITRPIMQTLQQGELHEQGKECGDCDDDDNKPKILGVAEAKGFIFGKGLGFGFFDNDGAIIRAPKKYDGIFSESTGFVKFGFCYDP